VNPQKDWNLFWHALTYILTARRRILKHRHIKTQLNQHLHQTEKFWNASPKFLMWIHFQKWIGPLILFQSTGVVSHVNLPSQQAESDAAPALTPVPASAAFPHMTWPPRPVQLKFWSDTAIQEVFNLLAAWSVWRI
jgi:hypothetical protein